MPACESQRFQRFLREVIKSSVESREFFYPMRRVSSFQENPKDFRGDFLKILNKIFLRFWAKRPLKFPKETPTLLSKKASEATYTSRRHLHQIPKESTPTNIRVIRVIGVQDRLLQVSVLY